LEKARSLIEDREFAHYCINFGNPEMARKTLHLLPPGTRILGGYINFGGRWQDFD
jgi:hypothetical protein